MTTLLVSQRNFESHVTPTGHPERPDRIRAIEEALNEQAFPGLLRKDSPAGDLGLDLPRSFVVGDRWHDIAAGHAVGARGVLVRTGLGSKDEAAPHPATTPDVIVDNLAEAAAWILQQP